MSERRRCWIVTDGATGNVKPCEALAERLDVAVTSFAIGLRAPWSWLAPRLVAGAGQAVTGPLAARLSAPLPDLVIGAGRRAALLLRLLRRLARQRGERCFTVQLLDPRIDPAHFDLVICPLHDGLSGPNVLATRLSLHAVDERSLAAWRERFPALGDRPSPRVALLIGASTRSVPLRDRLLNAYVEAAERVVGDAGTLLVSTSQRTPAGLAARLRDRYRDRAVLASDGAGNPYPGFLAWAEHFFVTPDSVNMISEALGTGRPVYTDLPPEARSRFRRFHRALADDGLLLPLAAAPAAPAQRPLRETAAIADEVRRRWLGGSING